jgi:hypothetical protein
MDSIISPCIINYQASIVAMQSVMTVLLDALVRCQSVISMDLIQKRESIQHLWCFGDINHRTFIIPHTLSRFFLYNSNSSCIIIIIVDDVLCLVVPM